MNDTLNIEIAVEPATAVALSDGRRREAVGRLVDRLVHPRADDPLIALFEHVAREAGLTDTDIEVELAAYNRESRG